MAWILTACAHRAMMGRQTWHGFTEVSKQLSGIARLALAEEEKPNKLEDTLSCTSEDLYPNVATVLTILLTMPVSIATPERSFSTTRRAKTYVRSTMLKERLSSLALMHAYREMPIDPRESRLCEQTKKACI